MDILIDLQPLHHCSVRVHDRAAANNHDKDGHADAQSICRVGLQSHKCLYEMAGHADCYEDLQVWGWHSCTQMAVVGKADMLLGHRTDMLLGHTI